MAPESTIEYFVRNLAEKIQCAFHDYRTAHFYAWALVEKCTKTNKEILLTKPGIPLTQADYEQIERWIHELCYFHKPIQYILETIPFIDLTLFVRPPVLIPRPETEQWCADLIAQLRAADIHTFTALDVCTGNGCIALALAHAFPQATIHAADISEDALALAQENAAYNNIHNIHFLQSDLFDEIPETNRYDIITSNPPYIAPAEWHTLKPTVTEWEDERALVASDDGLFFITKIIAAAPRYLVPWQYTVPQLWIEIGYDQGGPVAHAFEESGFVDVAIKQDLYGNDRVVTGRLGNE